LYILSETSIKTNLTEERPQWKLSVYGPAKEEPNLIVGTDKSCEEDRLLYYMSMLAGNESQYASI
jgi:nucleoporin NUP42